MYWAESFSHYLCFAMDCKLPTFVRLYWRLNSPKHQSGLNLVYSTTKSDKVTVVCMFVCWHSTGKILYHSIVFIICPQQLSAVQKHLLLTQAMMTEEALKLADHNISTLVTCSSFVFQEMKNLSWNGLTVYKPNTTHFLGVKKKKIGPGCSRSNGWWTCCA